MATSGSSAAGAVYNIHSIEFLFNLLESNKSDQVQEVKQMVSEQFNEGQQSQQIRLPNCSQCVLSSFQ